VQELHVAVGFEDFVDDGWGGCDQVEVEFPAEAFLDDFEVQEAQETAAEAEAECCRGFGFVVEAGVVEAKAPEGVAEFLEIIGIDGVEAAPDDRARARRPGDGRR
jgi:hypothetical protein